jgi:hypothetical protein
MFRRQLRTQVLDGEDGKFFDESGALLLTVGPWSLVCRIIEDQVQPPGATTSRYVPVRLSLEIRAPRPPIASRLTGNLHLSISHDIPVTLALRRTTSTALNRLARVKRWRKALDSDFLVAVGR